MKRLLAVFVFFPLPALLGQAPNPPASSNPPASPTGGGFLVRGLKLFEPDDPAPIGAKQRFRNYVNTAVGPLPIIGGAAVAGVQQADNYPHEWGQGSEGYFKRWGSVMAYNVVRQTITYGLSEALHEDNRYFASNRKGWRRVEYSLISPATARHRNGRRYVSVSSLAGMAGASGLALYWSPRSWQGWDHAGRTFALTYAGQAAINTFREFVPDLIHALRK